VGASTHPGGGVPVVFASAMNADDLIEKYEK
jgi:phytoene dehydrogenase-like protein